MVVGRFNRERDVHQILGQIFGHINIELALISIEVNENDMGEILAFELAEGEVVEFLFHRVVNFVHVCQLGFEEGVDGDQQGMD